MRLGQAPRRRGRVEIIPMIDTMFFLLVFFMMATLSMTVQRGLSVSLPRAASGGAAPELTTLTLTRDGALYLDKERMASTADAAHRLGAGAARAVLINADRTVEHGRVVEVLDLVRRAGVERVAVAVAPAGEERHP